MDSKLITYCCSFDIHILHLLLLILANDAINTPKLSDICASLNWVITNLRNADLKSIGPRRLNSSQVESKYIFKVMHLKIPATKYRYADTIIMYS